MSEARSNGRADTLRDAVRAKYREVACEPTGQFAYPVGRASALGLGYEPAWLEGIPDAVVDRFVGAGNPFAVERPGVGERVLDLGCGCGLDVFVASRLVGAEGYVVGIDLTPEMVRAGERAAAAWPLDNVHLQLGTVEALPYGDASFDRVISNGVLNLVPDKAAAFSQACRVLRPGGRFVVADLLVTETVPAEVLASLDAWST